MLITILPIAYLIHFGSKRLRSGNGATIYSLTGIALLIGIATPFVAMVASIFILSFFDQNSSQCYTFIVGYIGIGIIIEIAVIPLTMVILKIIEEAKRDSS